jgi:hypothetical protein
MRRGRVFCGGVGAYLSAYRCVLKHTGTRHLTAVLAKTPHQARRFSQKLGLDQGRFYPVIQK